MLKAADLNVIPARQSGYFHCCVFPVGGPSAWPRCFSDETRTPILVEYDVAGDAPAGLGWKPLDAQRSPDDVRANLRLLGDVAAVDAHGVPIARKEHLVTGHGQYVHHLTAALPKVGARSDGVWQRVAAEMKWSLVPESWAPFDGCEVIYHYMDGEFAYFLSPDERLWRSWLEEVIDARFDLTRWNPSAPRAVASWVVESFDGSGVRLCSIRMRDDGMRVVVKGFYGRDPRSPIQLGASGGPPFEAEVPLP